MARIEESVEIKRPVDKVFAYTTDAKSCANGNRLYRKLSRHLWER